MGTLFKYAISNEVFKVCVLYPLKYTGMSCTTVMVNGSNCSVTVSNLCFLERGKMDLYVHNQTL